MPDDGGRGHAKSRLKKQLLDLEHLISADSHGYHREIARQLQEIHDEVDTLERSPASNPP